MKTLITFAAVAALTIALVAAQGSSKAQTSSCCGGMEAIQHESHHADKPVVAKIVKGVQKATITIENGAYKPAAIQVQKGKPVELTLKGGENLGCAGTVVFKSLKIQRSVSSGKSVVVKFTPKAAGEIPFTCSMEMARGKILVK